MPSARFARLVRQFEQRDGAWILAVHPMAEPRDPKPRRPRVGHHETRDLGQRQRVPVGSRKRVGDDLHARQPGAGVGIANRQDACRDRGFGRLPVAARREPCGGRARRPGSVVRDGNEHRVDETSLTVIRHAASEQQTDDVGVGAGAHERDEVLTSHVDPFAVGVRDCGAPALHQSPPVSVLTPQLIKVVVPTVG